MFSRSVFGLLLLAVALPAAGQACDNTLTARDGYTVGRVTLHVRHLPAQPLATKVGEPYNPASQSLSVEQLSGILDRDLAGNAALANVLSRIPAASYTYACTHILPPADCATLVHQSKCVEVVFSRYQIGLDLDQLSSFSAATPRSPFASFLAGVPRTIRILTPTATVLNDDRRGLTPQGTARLDLLSLPRMLAGRPGPPQPVGLTVAATAGHSLQSNFYTTSEQLDFGLNRAGTLWPQLSLHVTREDSRQPLGLATDTLGSTAAGLQLTQHTAFAPAATLVLWSGINTASHSTPSPTSELDSLTTVIAEGHAHGLLTRSALWFTSAFPAQQASYERVVFSTSAYKELATRPNQAIGVRLTASTGAAWGPLPSYAAFYPGNNAGSFLFSDRQTLLTQMPAGPAVRSLGTAEGSRDADAGAPAFFGFSTTVSFPVPRWSRPLIPDVQVFDTLTLKDMLKRTATVSSRNLLAASLQQSGLSPEEAGRQAAKVIAEDVAPAVTYIADQANLYSIKPIVALDYARTGGTARTARFVSLGPGLEFTLVNVALQAGYARTLAAPATARQGNFFLEVQFRNFF